MTTLSKKGGNFLSHQTLLACIFFLTYNISYGQLDSATVNLTYGTTPSIEDTTIMVDVINVEVTADDVDFVGEVIVTVYDDATDFPFYKIKLSLQEFIDNGLKNVSTLTVPIEDIDLTMSWRIETIVRNYQGGSMPAIITNH